MDVPFGKKLRLPFTSVDAAGVAAPVDDKNPPKIATTLGTVVEVVGSGTEWSALIDPGPVATDMDFDVTGEADADLGDGEKTFAFSLGTHKALAVPGAAGVTLGTPSVE